MRVFLDTNIVLDVLLNRADPVIERMPRGLYR
jgi:hypothetical protein